MSRGRAQAALVVAIAVLGSRPAMSEETIFRFVDKRGTLHLTDRLGDVPEPYYSMYVAKLRALEQQRAQAGAPPPVPSTAPPPGPGSVETGSVSAPPPSLVDEEIKRYHYWRALIQRWRDALAKATAEVEAIDQERDQAAMNPVLVQTPQVQEALAEIDRRRVQALERLEAARHMLLVELPARARKEQVPPKWLL
ncbi:MAG: hypothetical protein HY903_10115 [Deltaproteobacteria bacterium]|nr:hypothetical protein [Deltaproteobacteria bacterium]